MINWLLDALSAPGDYARGLLAGRAGDRVGSRELLSGWGVADEGDDSLGASVRDFAVGTLTDPLTYLGGALGGLAAKGAYRVLGPMHRGGAEKLAGAAAAGRRPAEMAEQLAGSPHASRLLAEIPPGSTYLPGGSNALPFRTPRGDVVRIAQGARGAPPPSRAAVPEMLQPTRNVTYGDFRVERVPFADHVGNRALWGRDYGELSRGLISRGWHPSDLHPGNVGQLGGRSVLIDPGAAVPLPRWAGPREVAPTMHGATPWRFLAPGLAGGAGSGALLGALGGY